MNAQEESLLRSNGLKFNKDFCPVCRKAGLKVLGEELICIYCFTKFETGYASSANVPRFRHKPNYKEKKLINKMPLWSKR